MNVHPKNFISRPHTFRVSQDAVLLICPANRWWFSSHLTKQKQASPTFHCATPSQDNRKSTFFFFLLSGLSHLRKKRTELVFNRRLLRKSSVQCFHVNLPNRLCDQENGQNDHVSHSFIWPSRPVCNRPEYRFNLCRLLNSLKTTDTCPRVRVPTHWWLLLVLGDLAWHLWDHTVLMLT